MNSMKKFRCQNKLKKSDSAKKINKKTLMKQRYNKIIVESLFLTELQRKKLSLKNWHKICIFKIWIMKSCKTKRMNSKIENKFYKIKVRYLFKIVSSIDSLFL